MEVKPGYKQTEVGVIPEDWDVVSASDACSKIQDGTHFSPRVGGNDYLYITSKNIRFGYLDVTSAPRIDADQHQEIYRRCDVKKGDLLLTKDGANTGNVCLNKLDEEFSLLSSVAFLRFQPDKHSAAYFLQQILAPQGQRQIQDQMAGNAITRLTLEKIKKLKFPAPPTKVEEEVIAAALSDVDALIKALDRLIAKKQDIKEAAMQELLTGKRRLPGFSGEWRTRLLGEVIMGCSSGATPYRGRPNYYKGKVKWITSGELNYNKIFDTIEHISEDAVQKTSLKLHPVGTFLMAITGLEAAGTRGACGIVGSPATTNQSCMAIYPTSELKTEYLYHYYVFRGKTLALQYCQGTKQQSYTAKLVRLLPIDMPPTVEEQTAIATVLSDMDAEIASLEARRDKTKALKQGMMQELLTGRIRLVEGGAA